MSLSRRSLLIAASLAATPRPAWAQNLSAGAFTHGVASGDPLADGVMLWTRFVHANDGRIAWEVAADDTFAAPVARGEAVAAPHHDFCAKIDVRGLAPGRRYFYRFLSASGPSPTGRTLTAPATDGEALTIALFSCSNLPFGYFHAYGDAAERDDIDLALHVGDYLYELPRGAYPSAEEAVPGREIEPAGETLSLQDYYQRYAAYHRDPDLLELRRLKPMAAIWDDHEIADNAWSGGALGHNRNDGDYPTRAAAAMKAYFDWMPIRAGAGAAVTRTLDWGGLARILLLDTRLAGRTAQLAYNAALVRRLMASGAGGEEARRAFEAQLNNPARSILGATQEQWLSQALAHSKAAGQTWQIIAQPLVTGDQHANADMLALLPERGSSNARRYFVAGVTLSGLGLPWNLDAWAGYPGARARLLQACADHANNALVLGGDSHNCWVNTLAAPNDPARVAAIEFAGGSVTSPGFERSLSNAAPGERERRMRSANPQLAFCDLTHRGYALLRLTRAACEAEWRAFADVRNPQRGDAMVTRISAAASAAGGPGAWSVQA
ncbi:MAG: alkaline phosphatase [Hyphomonadaceae bacterium]